MKNLISTILRTGFTKSQKPLADYIKYLYPLKHIFAMNQIGWVTCNHNAFWEPENMQNRLDLLADVSNIQKRGVADNAYFHILNRFENGDKYGIETN